jgi:phosphomannomutase/phosphoglucomutase
MVHTGIEVHETHQRMPVTAPANIFRAYDVRGLAGKELTPEVAQGLGWALAEMARANGVSRAYVAHDPRLSSAELYEALADGLMGQGMQVIELGMGPVALLYHAMHQDPESAAVMVTGSHNPPEYNGFKLYLRTEPVQGEQLLALRERMLEGGFEPVQGACEQRDVRREYLDAVAASVTLSRPHRIVVDAGNGAAGELACALFEMLGCDVTPLHCEPDGRFPHHHPDPSQPENLEDLRREVMARHADLGVAFDGDGDRIGVVDNRGETVWSEQLLMLLAADVLRRHPGADVIYDVKSSRHLAGFILSNGGRPIMWRSGHSLMKAKMRETGALVGGEFSGHIYIKERWSGSDDAIYVAARLLEIFADDPRPVHEQVAELPYGIGTPEYQLRMSEGEPLSTMQAIMAAADFPDARVVDLDGLRIEFDDAWGLVRPSNTVPSLVFRFEADTPEALEMIKQRFRELMQQALPDRDLPF